MPPSPPPVESTPEFRSQLETRMLQDTQAAVEEDAQEQDLFRRKFAIDRQQKTRMAAEQQVEQTQQQQMEALRMGFAPDSNDLDTHVKQAAAFRSGTSNRPYQDVLEEERLHEGSRRAMAFQKSVEGLSPLQQAEFGTMAAGLQKEGLSAAKYQEILEAVRSGQPLENLSPGEIKKANRIYRATEGEDLIDTPERDFLLPDLPGSLKKGVQLQDTVIEEVRALGTASQYAHSKGPDVEQALTKVLEVNSLTEEEYDALSSDDRIFAISQALVQPFPGASNSAFQELTFRERPTKVRPFQAAVNVEQTGREAGAVATTGIRAAAEEVLPGEGRPSLEAIKEGGLTGAIERSIDENVEILGVKIGPADLLNPLNLIPLPLVDPLIARLISIPVRMIAHTGGKVTLQVAKLLGREAAEKATDETLDTATRTALRDFATEIVPTAQGAPLEPAAVRRPAPKTGDTVALRSAPDTPVGKVIAQSEQGVTIRPDNGGKPFLRSRERVQAIEAAPAAVVEDVSPRPLQSADDLVQGEVLRFHGTTETGRAGITGEGAIRPTEAARGTLPGVYLHETEELARVSAGTSARLADDVAAVVPVARPAGANIAPRDIVDGVKTELRLGDTPDDMIRLADELQTRGYQGADISAEFRGATQTREVIFAPKVEAPAQPALARAIEPEAAPVKPTRVEAGTPEFDVRSTAVRDRLKTLMDDPAQPASVRRTAKLHFDKVCA